jgi:hypothetical protein
MKQIIVDVLPDGSTKIRTTGFVGSLCRLASKWLEDAMGHKTDEQLTPEFYQQAERKAGQVGQ